MKQIVQRMTEKAQQSAAVYMVVGLLCLVPARVVLAQAMPWESPLQTLQASFEGPVAESVLVLAIIGLGLTIAFGAAFGVLQWAIGIVFGGAIVLSAATLVGSFFSGGGA